MMEIYHRLCLACVGGTAISVILSAVCFVKLDIRTAWRVLTGGRQEKPEKSRKKSMRKMKQDAAEEPKTALLKENRLRFRVEREIMLVHTEEEIP